MKLFGKSLVAIRTAMGAAMLGALFACAPAAVSACEFRAGSTTGTAAFPGLDPVTAPNVTTTVQLDVRCSPAGDWAVAQFTWTSANGGASIGRLVGGNPPYAPGIDYSVTMSVNGGGANRTLIISLQIAGSAYTNASAGNYSDILTVMVTP